MFRQIILKRSNQVGWDRRGMQHAWERCVQNCSRKSWREETTRGT